MDRALPEMMINCLNTPTNLSPSAHTTDMSVLDRQRARMKWQKQQQQQEEEHPPLYNGNPFGIFSIPNPPSQQLHDHQQLQDLVNNPTGFKTRAIKPDPDNLDIGWPDLGSMFGSGTGIDMNYDNISRTLSCPPAMADHVETTIDTEKLSLAGRKRKNSNVLKVVMEEDWSKDKTKIRTSSSEGESKITEQNSDDGHGNKKNKNKKKNNKETASAADKSKVSSDAPKTDYIHVRARRGQATDSHSLAERVRREKISERMRYLQDLVPGCNKIIGKAGMLDEIINYVQSLQRQVEFLSMKLASLNPGLDFNIDSFFPKEVYSSFPTFEMSPEIVNPNYVQSNPSQMPPTTSMDMGILNTLDIGLRRTISTPPPPVSVQKTNLDSSFFNNIIPPQISEWDASFHNIYAMELLQGKATAAMFPCQQFTGVSDASMKIERCDN